MRNKGQTATEYLVILAIVIVIALIVVGVLGGIPGIGGAAGGNVGDLYFSTADIAIKDVSMSAGGDDKLIVKNNNEFDIELEQITIDGTPLLASGSPANITIRSGGEYLVGNTTIATNDFTTCTAAGDDFSVSIAINYTNKNTGQTFPQNYDRTLEGICAQ